MINIWEFEYCGMVQIIDVNDKVYVGEAQEITDESERSDDEKAEDGLTILTDGKLVEFYASEIKAIKRL